MNRDASIECRLATTDDWQEIWPILSTTIRRGDTYTYPPDIEEDAARRLWLLEKTSKTATYVATVDGVVVATAYLKPNQPGLGDHVANAGWMVAAEVTGQGIGRVLAHHVIGEAQRLGYRGMQFNTVVATNERAIKLWESLGFAIVGTVPRAFRLSADELVSAHIMYRDL